MINLKLLEQIVSHKLVLAIYCLATLSLLSCEKNNHKSGPVKVVEGKNFFENSRRSVIAQASLQSKGIAYVEGCTGFFVKNDLNKNLVVTARHCFDFKATEWCKKNHVIDYSSKEALQCKKVVAGDTVHDTIIFEVQNSKRDRSNDFILSNFAVEKDIPLNMLGFPVDPLNSKNNLLSTQHCWVTATSVDDPFAGQREEKYVDQNFSHNCSTYGGNSGGPMFIEGTRIVIGLPNTYVQDDFENRNRDGEQAAGISIAAFVDDFRDQITELKLKLADKAFYTEHAFFDEGTFTSATIEGCSIVIGQVTYNTRSYPAKIIVNYVGDTCNGEEIYTCKADGKCIGSISETSLQIINKDKFNYTKNKASSLFVRSE